MGSRCWYVAGIAAHYQDQGVFCCLNRLNCFNKVWIRKFWSNQLCVSGYGVGFDLVCSIFFSLGSTAVEAWFDHILTRVVGRTVLMIFPSSGRSWFSGPMSRDHPQLLDGGVFITFTGISTGFNIAHSSGGFLYQASHESSAHFALH